MEYPTNFIECKVSKNSECFNGSYVGCTTFGLIIEIQEFRLIIFIGHTKSMQKPYKHTVLCCFPRDGSYMVGREGTSYLQKFLVHHIEQQKHPQMESTKWHFSRIK